MSKTVHMRLDIRGALMNWTRESDVAGITHSATGKQITLREAKRELIELLASGHDFLPVGECDNFDPKEGCKGHKKEGL